MNLFLEALGVENYQNSTNASIVHQEEELRANKIHNIMMFRTFSNLW